MLVTLLLASALVGAPPTAASGPLRALSRAAAERLTVEVNPGMELIAIMAWLAGRYPTPPDSKYKTDVWNHFARFRTHSALDAIRAGQLFPDFTETGLWLGGFPAPVLALPESSTWYTAMGRARVETILQGAIRFAKDSHFAEFRRSHVAEYAAWSSVLSADLRKSGALTVVERFYRSDAQIGAGGAIVHLYLEPLNGWGAHMISAAKSAGANADGTIRFQLGPAGGQTLPDSPLSYALNRSVQETIWHEAGHGFVKSLLLAKAAGVDSLGRLFDSTNTNLARQNIKSWSYAFEECLVRSVVAAMIGEARGTAVMQATVAQEYQNGFVWVPLLTDLLRREYIAERSRYPTLDSFSGRILEALATRRSVADAPRAPN
jgi:hypothetical protein